ncbi:MAG: hypothetical protein ACYTAO_09015 [Planctomycetota bacterium]|jgi:hypothetical protein
MKDYRAMRSYLAGLLVLSYAWRLLVYLIGGVESPLFPFMMLFLGLVAVGFLIVKKKVGTVVSQDVPGVRRITCEYLTDPEGPVIGVALDATLKTRSCCRLEA